MVTGVLNRSIYYAIVFVLVMLVVSTKTNAQQETMYTQYMSNVLSINPAYAGSTDLLSITAVSRNQWIGIEGTPETQTFSVHSPITKYRMGLGATFLKDKIGPITQTGFNFDYSYTVDFDRNRFLAFGLKGGVNFYYAGLTDLQLINPDDPTFAQNDLRRFLPNVGVGMYYYTDRFYAGLSAPKLIENVINKNSATITQNVSREEMHFYFMMGYVFHVNRILKFKPHFMTKFVQDAPVSIDLSAQFLIYDRLWLGGMYRFGDSVGALMQIQVSNQIKVGYSYDVSINELRTYNRGTHEIMVSYDFNFGKGRVTSPRYF